MRVEFYQHGDKIPFNEFWKRLRDNHAKKAILQRLHRVELGNFGDWKNLGEIGELRIPAGPGYRIYFGRDGNALVILLTAGSKKSQQRDIRKAKEYWADYLGRK